MPEQVTAFIEIVPTDTVKYEIDKQTGYLKIDRPQKFSNIVPALYGFLPQTYCAEGIAELARKYSGKDITQGDGDHWIFWCFLSVQLRMEIFYVKRFQLEEYA